jgi:hypothetical protein
MNTADTAQVDLWPSEPSTSGLEQSTYAKGVPYRDVHQAEHFFGHPWKKMARSAQINIAEIDQRLIGRVL